MDESALSVPQNLPADVLVGRWLVISADQTPTRGPERNSYLRAHLPSSQPEVNTAGHSTPIPF